MTFTSFEAEPESLYDLVSKNGRGLYIPPYQRDYSWDKEKVDRLISDLLQSIKSFITKEERSTFLGTVIVLEGKAKEIIDPQYKRQAYGNVLSVIDGQQRLTTLLILCLVLVVNLDLKWKNLTDNTPQDGDYNIIKNWIEESLNKLKGDLKKIIFEEQNNGNGVYRYFPKMIRSYVDQWSYEEDNAKYDSPIAWLLFEYIKFDHLSNEDQMQNSYDSLLKLSLSENPSKEKEHIYKTFKRLNKSILKLTHKTEDEVGFPNLKQWVDNKNAQEHFFEEEFPSELINAITLHEDNKYLDYIFDILATLAFTKFVINNIAIIVVVVTNEDYAFDIFEALNSTGQPLTAIETFTPTIVKEVGIEAYKNSKQKEIMDIISDYLKDFTTQNQKQKAAKDIVVSFALAEKGERVGKGLSEQRTFMRSAFNSSKDMEGFLQNLLAVSRFYQKFWIKSDEAPKLCKESLSLDDESALCLQYLVSLKHTITIPLLSQYMIAVESSPSDKVDHELSEFERVIKAVTTFTTLWRSTRPTTDGIDKVYRDIMSTGLDNIISAVSRQKRTHLPPSYQIESYFKEKLKKYRDINNYKSWSDKVKNKPIYEYSEHVTKFILLISMNDIVQADNSSELQAGKKGTFSTLKPISWNSTQFETIEHIFPQNPENKSDWPSDLFEDESIKHQLGNLVLLPKNSNSSVKNSSWNIKQDLYKALASDKEGQASDSVRNLNSENKTNYNPDIYTKNYLPHIKVLTEFNEINSGFINYRNQQILDFASITLQKWLNLDN